MDIRVCKTFQRECAGRVDCAWAEREIEAIGRRFDMPLALRLLATSVASQFADMRPTEIKLRKFVGPADPPPWSRPRMPCTGTLLEQ